jgi:hypothetical protein
VALFLIAAAPADAQFTSQQATNLVVDQILTEEIEKVDVFMIESVKSNQSAISLRNNETIDLPYSSNWVFFVDDRPFANWAHTCRYIFVDAATGAYQVVSKNFFPVDWKSAYTLVSEMPRPNPVDLPLNPDAAIDGLPPNPHLFAVIINGVDMDRYWNDVSAIYNTLIDVYGFTKENIFVHYDYGSSYLGDDLDDPNDPSDDIDYDAYKETILHTFSEMAGESNTSWEIPELGPADGLFIFVTDHGFMDEGHSYILLPTQPLGDWEMAEALEGINCAQIIAVFEPCEIGGFKTELSDYVNYDVSCKNRSIQTASNDETSWAELHITGGNYDEFVYYWTAAARGYYPDDDLPWEESYAVGSLPVEQYFPVYPEPNWHPGDFNPDANSDGHVQMEEAFVYANSLDTWSDDGYYYYPAIPGQEPEEPLEFTEIGFDEDLLTLKGLAGLVTSPVTVQGNFIIGGTLTINEFGYGEEVTFDDGSSIYMVNPQSKIVINENSKIEVHDDVTIAGNSISNEIEVYGRLFTPGQNIKFKGLDGGQWRGIELHNTNIVSGYLHLFNTEFEDCMITGNAGKLSLSYSTLTRSGVYITSSYINLGTNDLFYCYTDFTSSDPKSDDLFLFDNDFYGQGIIKPAVNVNSFGNYTIRDTYVNDHTEGIKVFNSGTGTTSHIIDWSYIHNCSNAGITIYHSTARLYQNSSNHNGRGVMLYDRSSVEMEGYEDAWYVGETQRITDNSSYEVYASRGSFPHIFEWNVIRDEDNTEPMVYTTGEEGPFDVRNNYWGYYFDPVEDFFPWVGYIYEPIWEIPFPKSNEDQLKNIYYSALQEKADSNFVGAISELQELILYYPESRFAQASLKELYSLEEYADDDYEGLKSYYSSNPVIQNNAELKKIAEFLVNFCEIKLENWSTAIAWFENLIQNPTSYEDSIFAIIDLGYAYFLMEQSGYKNSYKGAMIEHIPVSTEQFNEKRDFLLSLLPGDELSKTMKENINKLKTGELLQNVPNPVKNQTQIWYKLENESVVSINVFNSTGQLIYSADEGTKIKGNHYINFDATGLKNGIYFYSININGQTTDSKKMTIMK